MFICCCFNPARSVVVPFSNPQNKEEAPKHDAAVPTQASVDSSMLYTGEEASRPRRKSVRFSLTPPASALAGKPIANERRFTFYKFETGEKG